MGFGLFFLGEYTNMFLVAAIATTLFLGGWHGPAVPHHVGHRVLRQRGQLLSASCSRSTGC